MMVFMQLMEGPNLSIFLAMAAAPINDSALLFFPDIISLLEIIISYCSAYLVTRNRQKYCTSRQSYIMEGILSHGLQLMPSIESTA